MSWNINFIGKPANVVAALQKHSETLEGLSKKEFDNALPHLIGLVQQNHHIDEQYAPVIQVQANGHAYVQNDVLQYGNCKVQIETLPGGNLV